jgi:hypothetical protein|nr:hypothetical protein [Kofleriaceae bacterium]
MRVGVVVAAVAVGAAVAACAPPEYVATDMIEPRASLGCVDVSVVGAWPGESTGPVAVVDLGSLCERGVAIDLRALRAVGIRTSDDVVTRVPLVAYDPHGEMGVRTLGPGAHGSEWIEFHPADAIDSIDHLDVDAGAIVVGELPSAAHLVVDVPPHHPMTAADAR